MKRENRIVLSTSGYEGYIKAGWAVLLKAGMVAMAPIMLLVLIVMAPVAILGWIAEKCKGDAE